MLETFRDRLYTEIFPGRSEVPKTLIFAKDDAHADEIVQIAREVFGKGNDFAAKITYKATGKKADELIAAFRNAYNPRIAVTVDMIATGTDVKPLECVFFMRSVKSRTYFEQMKGRGVRVIGDADFQAVTPDARAKDRFVIVDAVGVTESDLVDTVPLDRKPTVPLERLLKRVSFAAHNPDPDVCSAIAARLTRLDRKLGPPEREELAQLAGGRSLKEIAGDLVAALDPDRQLAAAREAAAGGEPDVDGIAAAAKTLLAEAAAPLATSPDLRQRIVEVRRLHEQAIDETSADELLEAGYSAEAADRARRTIESWERFCEDNRDEITALQILYARRQPQRLTFREVKELAQAIGRPPHQWTPGEALAGVRAARPLEGARLRRARPHRPRLPRPRRPPPGRRARRLPRPRPRPLPRLAPPAGERRPHLHRRAARLARAHPRPRRRRARHQPPTTSRYTPFLEAGGLGKAAQVFGDDLDAAARRDQRGAGGVSELPPGWVPRRSRTTVADEARQYGWAAEATLQDGSVAAPPTTDISGGADRLDDVTWMLRRDRSRPATYLLGWTTRASPERDRSVQARQSAAPPTSSTCVPRSASRPDLGGRATCYSGTGSCSARADSEASAKRGRRHRIAERQREDRSQASRSRFRR